ncbi:MAG TPA: GNAT family N-acetyltransferase [Burkholderiaceae bacterium]|nr:GNAT family N-acetyltransferase [Burkholderiaceae bacterium]
MNNAVKTRPLSPSSLEDFLRFFDGDAFRDNPEWSSCYCQCFYEDHTRIAWSTRTAAENRAAACARIDAKLMRGYLAYVGGRVVGWCNAAPRNLLHALDQDPIENADRVGVIVCFLTAPQFRNQGIASALLSAACEGLRSEGMQFAEANPRPDALGAAANHFGPLHMYLAAGFAVDRADSDGSVWVRKKL